MTKSTILASATAAIAAASSALAGPLLTITGSVGGYAPITVTSNGVDTATAGRYSYIGGTVSNFPSPDWAISWDLVGESTSAFPTTTFVTNGFRVQNFTGSAKTFDIVLSLATPGPTNPMMECTALLGGTLTSDATGSTATLSSTGPLWVGQINGVSRDSSAIAILPQSTTGTSSFGPQTGLGWKGTVSGALASVGYRLQFTLGAKSTAVFTGYWDGQIVPTPGAFALLAVAGVASRRRRTN